VFRHLKWFSLVAAFAGVLATARAQTAPLSLDDCVKLAMEAPSPASVAERETAVAAEGQTIARSFLLPQVRYHNGLIYNSPLLDARDRFSYVAANGIREYLSTIDSALEIDLSGRLRAGLALARAGRDLAGVDLRLAQRDLRRAVAVAFYDVLLARKLVESEQAGLDEAQDFESLTRARQQRGEASMADIHRAAAQRARFEQRLSQSQLDARLANQVLASFWTADVDQELTLRDDLDQPPALPVAAAESSAARVDAAIRRRPEFDRLAALQRGFQAERNVARKSLLPQTDVVFQYGIDSNNVRIADRGYHAFVNLNIPVFDWFRLRATARQARYREQQTEQQQAMAERTFSREYLAARAQVQSWHERVPMALSELTDARESLRLARLLYESGEGLALDVVVAQTEVTDAATAYFNALAAYQRSQVDFEVASGQ
jgi:outer membrane protein TolC